MNRLHKSFHEARKEKLATIVDLRKEAKRHGATVHNNSGPRQYSYGLEAPKGTVWKSEGLHEYIVWWYKGDPEWKHAPICDAIDRMSQGVEPCPDLESCEWCNPEEEMP